MVMAEIHACQTKLSSDIYINYVAHVGYQETSSQFLIISHGQTLRAFGVAKSHTS